MFNHFKGENEEVQFFTLCLLLFLYLTMFSWYMYLKDKSDLWTVYMYSIT